MLIVPHLILNKDDKILLTKRSHLQKFWANHWHCVTGSIEQNESPKEAIIREAFEEIGIILENVQLITTIDLIQPDWMNPKNPFHSLELFFYANLPKNQTPINKEPLKQDSMDWFSLSALPSPLTLSTKCGLENHFKGINYGEFRIFTS